MEKISGTLLAFGSSNNIYILIINNTTIRKMFMKKTFYSLRTGAMLLAFTVSLNTAFAQSTPEAVKPLDRQNMDQNVSPAVDFYEYANGTWLKNNPIPGAYGRWGAFEELQERNNTKLQELLEGAAANKNAAKGSDLQKIGDFFSSGMDSAAIEKAGINPLLPELKKIDAIKSIADVKNSVAHLHQMGIYPLFDFYGEQDAKNSTMVIAQLSQGGLGLPDRDYYVNEDEQSKELRNEYLKHVSNMLQLLGESRTDADKDARTVMEIETRLAKASFTLLELRDPNATYNKISLKELRKISPDFSWDVYFKNIGLAKPGDINVVPSKFFAEVSKMTRDLKVADWKTYLRWHLVHNTAAYLSSPFVQENFNFYGKKLTGAKEMRPRWKRIIASTDDALGEALGHVYVEKYFPPEAKSRALKIVSNLKEAFGERIRNLSWMSEETKKQALTKLNAFGVKIGYPDKWTDYSSLEITRDSYVTNVLNASRFAFQKNLEKIGKPVDRTKWEMTPQTVNAYYHPIMNEIVFPAGILQAPFFDVNADDAVNYGAMGVVIGHEMTHGFDDQGRQYAADGNIKDWWTKEDGDKFNERSKVIIDQFNGYTPLDTNHINGALTQGENIADLGGLKIAFQAMQKSWQQSGKQPVIDGFTPEQRFFLSYAQVWRNNVRNETALLRLKTDVHSPGKYRVLGPLSNLTEFYEAFGVKPGDPMYRPAEKQVAIW